MTQNQIKVAENLQEKFFGYLPQNNWENIEVNRYWTDMNDAGLKQNTDIQKMCRIEKKKMNLGS